MRKELIMAGAALASISAMAQHDNQAIRLDYMDTSVRPQDDFYSFVNGNWMKTAEIPSDRSRWGSFDELRENTDKVSLELLNGLLGKKYPQGSDEQRITDLYQSYIDFDTRNKVALAPIHKYIDRINKIKNIKELEAYLTEVAPLGFNPFYSFYAGPHMKDSNNNAVYLGGGALGLGRTYYQVDDEKNRQTLSDYSAYINKLYPYSGSKTRDLKGAKVVDFEKMIASNLKTVVESRDPEKRYNPYKVKDLKQLVKVVDLEKFMKAYGVDVDEVIISEVKYFEALNNILTQENLPTIKEYMIFQLLDSFSGYSTAELDQLNFEFYGKKLSGQKEQRALEKRGLAFVNGRVGELLGKIYVKDNFPPEAKANAEELIDYLFKSFDMHIRNLEWMSDETKVKALEKLNKFTVKIGYPDKWRDYSALDINGKNLIENVLILRQFSFNDNLKDVGKPVDKSRWGMSPQTVNAYFRPSSNEIVFPAAILQPPFYNYKADPAVNFGGIGAVIGHEISHGFDDSGAKYDGDGNLVNWFTDEDLAKFKTVSAALADQYDKYEPVKGTFVNGKFTLGENIGDLGGAAVAYDALMLYLKDKGTIAPIDGFTQQQRFFLSWATIWRTKATEEALVNQVKTDPHSPGYFRAFGPLVNIDAFYEAFDIKEGDKMFVPKKDRIVIW
ncbi:M13 family metallopeptidase [Vaginella massiliensis]|uniref:M13 family metallopeptidase n=1 Tax=Vaginella massiliensis TaxID=1816680 RepID=UPI000838BAD8|nr:M13 family metallopeptidase [Vaginella massiliensis]